MKVYAIYEFYNNREPWEDNFTETKILKVVDSKEKALEFIAKYYPEGYVLKDEAVKDSREKWKEVKKDPKAREFYETADRYMYDTYRYIKGVEPKPDGSKTLFCHHGPLYTDPEYRIYFEEWEVE